MTMKERALQAIRLFAPEIPPGPTVVANQACYHHA